MTHFSFNLRLDFIDLFNRIISIVYFFVPDDNISPSFSHFR